MIKVTWFADQKMMAELQIVECASWADAQEVVAGLAANAIPFSVAFN